MEKRKLRYTTALRFLPPLNFITIHYAYFIATCLISAIVFWGASTPAQSVAFIDALFLMVSAMTLTGLNTINLSTLNTFQQFLLFLLILLGSTILVSSVTVHIRRAAFERRFQNIVKKQRRERKVRSRSSLALSKPAEPLPQSSLASLNERTVVYVSSQASGIGHSNLNAQKLDSPEQKEDMVCKTSEAAAATETIEREEPLLHLELPRIGDQPKVRFVESGPMSPRQRRHFLTMDGVGARSGIQNHPKQATTLDHRTSLERTKSVNVNEPTGAWNYLKSGRFLGRNSQFHSLTLAQREQLGGAEYRALVFLGVVVPLYYVVFQLLGCIAVGAWIANNASETTSQNGLNPWWVGVFNAVSAFGNNGMSLLDANMVAFQTSDFLLITMGFLILAGNTAYPIFLRLILWILYKMLPDSQKLQDYKSTLCFLLEHPRRCYTTLFPSTHTWWLVLALFVLNGIDWIAFEALNARNNTLGIPAGTRAIDGLFQALAVRSGGFYVVPIANLRIGLLVLYALMMYISVYPVAISMRSSNVYEERSLGIYADDSGGIDRLSGRDASKGFAGTIKKHFSNQNLASQSRTYFIRQQLRGQLAHDLWWICLAVLFITITETGSFDADPISYSVFNILFEVVSAYGTVGISVGLPNVAYSFCGGWHILSKLILCAVMLRGRHRGLPVAIDRAVLLPGEHLGVAEEQDAMLRAEMRLGETRSRQRRQSDLDNPV